MTIHKLFKKVEFDQKSYKDLIGVLHQYQSVVLHDINGFKELLEQVELDELQPIIERQSGELTKVEDLINYLERQPK